jgi:hypothetical protein
MKQARNMMLDRASRRRRCDSAVWGKLRVEKGKDRDMACCIGIYEGRREGCCMFESEVLR